jgi:hypothetical protein
VAAHPECPPHIIDHADHVGSTRSILDFAVASPAQVILVATEPHIIHQMEKAAPAKTFIGVPGGDGNCNCNMCPYMALNTLEKLYVALRDLEPRIELDPELMDRARVPLERMLEMAGRTVGQGDVGRPIVRFRAVGVALKVDVGVHDIVAELTVGAIDFRDPAAFGVHQFTEGRLIGGARGPAILVPLLHQGGLALSAVLEHAVAVGIGGAEVRGEGRARKCHCQRGGKDLLHGYISRSS